MEIEAEGQKYQAEIESVSARQADGIWYKEDFIMVSLRLEEAVESTLGFAVRLPVKRYGKEEFLAKVKAEAEVTLPQLLEQGRQEAEKRRYSQEKQKVLDDVVDEIKDMIGL